MLSITYIGPWGGDGQQEGNYTASPPPGSIKHAARGEQGWMRLPQTGGCGTVQGHCSQRGTCAGLPAALLLSPSSSSLPPAHALSPLPSLLSPCSRQTSAASGKMRGFPILPLSISKPCTRMRGRSAVHSRLASLLPSPMLLPAVLSPGAGQLLLLLQQGWGPWHMG